MARFSKVSQFAIFFTSMILCSCTGNREIFIAGTGEFGYSADSRHENHFISPPEGSVIVDCPFAGPLKIPCFDTLDDKFRIYKAEDLRWSKPNGPKDYAFISRHQYLKAVPARINIEYTGIGDPENEDIEKYIGKDQRNSYEVSASENALKLRINKFQYKNTSNIEMHQIKYFSDQETMERVENVYLGDEIFDKWESSIGIEKCSGGECEKVVRFAGQRGWTIAICEFFAVGKERFGPSFCVTVAQYDGRKTRHVRALLRPYITPGIGGAETMGSCSGKGFDIQKFQTAVRNSRTIKFDKITRNGNKIFANKFNSKESSTDMFVDYKIMLSVSQGDPDNFVISAGAVVSKRRGKGSEYRSMSAAEEKRYEQIFQAFIREFVATSTSGVNVKRDCELNFFSNETADANL